MNNFINNIQEGKELIIKNEKYVVKTKTWYSIEEDSSASYVKCELSGNKVLVIIPDDDLMYVGEVKGTLKYERLSDNEIMYKDTIFSKTGDGHQYVVKIEFGTIEEVEGKCIFEDYESEDGIISLGILTEKNNENADVVAKIISLNDVKENN